MRVEMPEAMKIRRLVATRKPLHHDAVPFVVCWAQKAGCTSILKWFLFHAGLLDEAMTYGLRNPGQVNAIHRYENEVFKSTEGYTEKLVNKLCSGSSAVNFVRCPYERTFSSYLHIHNPVFAMYPGWQSPELTLRKKILSDMYGDAFCIEYPISFQDYLLWLMNQDMEKLDPHHRPQYNSLFDSVTVEHFRLDDFADITTILEERFGLRSSSDPTISLFSSKHHVEKANLSRRAVLDFLTRGMPITRSEGFKPPAVTRDILAGTEMGRMIEELFKRDLDLYESIQLSSRPA